MTTESESKNENDHTDNNNNVECTCPECDPLNVKHRPKNTTDEHYWKAAGKFFGYPECCITEFTANAAEMKGPTGVRKQAAHYGFVPCEKHAQDIVDFKITHADLIENRISPLPFGSPRWVEPYQDLLLKQAVLGLMSGLPPMLVGLAITQVHIELGERALLKCKESYDEYLTLTGTEDTGEQREQ